MPNRLKEKLYTIPKRELGKQGLIGGTACREEEIHLSLDLMTKFCFLVSHGLTEESDSCCACGSDRVPVDTAASSGSTAPYSRFMFERQVPSVDFEIFSTLHSCLIKAVGTVQNIFNTFQKQFWGVSMYLTSVYRILTCKLYIYVCVYTCTHIFKFSFLFTL